MQFGQEQPQQSTLPTQMSAATGSSKVSNGRRNVIRRTFDIILSLRLLTFLNLVILVLVLILVVNPPYLWQASLNRQILDEVARKTSINPYESPVIAVVKDAETLRGENEIQKEVYKNAQDGDYVLAFSDKMIVYRRATSQIIYEGKSPGEIQQEVSQKLLDDITAAAKKKGLVGESIKAPDQAFAITDAEAKKKEDAKFYANVQKNDVVAVFGTDQLIVVYRPATGEIINSGKFTTTIQ